MAEPTRFEEIVDTVKNWGRWGADDQRGTLNFITEESRKRAALAVKDGTAFSLAMPLSLGGPQDGRGVPGRINPVRTMLAINTPMSDSPDSAAYSDDIVVTPVQAATHWDAFPHVSHRGLLYNGVSADTVTSAGATMFGIEHFGAVITRGVLIDLPRHLGVERLPAGFEVTRDLLIECEEAQGEPVLPGDIVLIRTGQVQIFFEGDIHGYHAPTSGLGATASLWFHEREVAAAATDTIAFDLLPSREPEVVLPVHILSLVMMGMPQGQNFVLEELAEACASDRRYSFLLDATPEPFVRSTGGMVAPVALR